MVPIGRDQSTEKEDTNTIADGLRIGLQELLRKAMSDQDADFLKEGVRVLHQALIGIGIASV